jgi:HD superfamily phosphodiesterase
MQQLLKWQLDKYQPQEEWYLHNSWSGLHGIDHAARVLVWADQIGHWMNEQGTPVDLEVVRWAATLHDVRRVSDGYDLEHGERAATWIKEEAARLPFTFDEKQLECTCYCCRWHVPHDHLAPAMTPELTCLKDADGLDRVRLGDLKSNYLRTPYAKSLTTWAEDLFRLSQQKRFLGKWESVRAAALELELWR